MTVDETIEKLKELSDEGLGDYIVQVGADLGDHALQYFYIKNREALAITNAHQTKFD
jgi:hypothetical protein